MKSQGQTGRPPRSKQPSQSSREVRRVIDERKGRRAEPTANELMFEAWKKLYETRRERLI